MSNFALEFYALTTLLTHCVILIACSAVAVDTIAAQDAISATTEGFPRIDHVDSQPLLLQVSRLADALEYIGNPITPQLRAELKRLDTESDPKKVAARVQELLDPLCLAAVEIGVDRLFAVPSPGEHELLERGWRSYLIKVCNRTGTTTRLQVESPNARSMPHSKMQEVDSRWLELAMFDGRPMQANLSGLELEYRIVQLYSRDAGVHNATLEFNVEPKPGNRGQQVRAWRFDKNSDGWQAANQTELRVANGSLVAKGLGNDPFISAQAGGATGELVLRFWAETKQEGVGQVFWSTEEQPSADAGRVTAFVLVPGAAHQYEVPLDVKGVLSSIRIDPNNKPCEMRFDWIDLSYVHRRGETWNSVPLTFRAAPAIPVTLKITDPSGAPGAAALVIRDRLQRIYPAQAKRLAPDLFFQPQIYRLDGEKIYLPPGEYDIRIWRGPHSVPETKHLVVGESPTTLEYEVRRWIDPTRYGWWSGDHHIHAAGCLHYQEPTQGVGPEDMLRQLMGEDLNVGCCLTWGPCFDYQKRFFTAKLDNISRYPYLLRYDVEVSGFGSHASGHLNLLRLTQQIYPGGESKDHWPTLGMNSLRWAKRQGAICGPAHSGNGLTRYVGRLDYPDGPHGLPHFNIPAYDGIGAMEYIVDVTHELEGPDGKLIPAIDFISTMNTPRQDEWNMWYHSLNCGFRLRASGETDFPCMSGERVGIGRVYVKTGDALNYERWAQGIQDGRSYVSDAQAHLIDFQAKAVGGEWLDVGDKQSEIALAAASPIEFRAQVAARLEDSPTAEVELIVNGYPVARQSVAADGHIQQLHFATTIENSSWVALRIFPHAHTNPFFVPVAGRPIRASKASAEWCLRGVEQCWHEKQRTYAAAEQDQALKDYEHARQVYRRIVSECER